MSNTESPTTSELDDLIKKYSPFLNEIRKRIIITFVVFAAASTIGFVFYEDIIKFFIEILSLKGINIVFTSPFQFINLAISCGVATGLIFVFPLLIFQVLSFLKPALRKKEYNTVVRLIPFSLLLFLVGFGFGFLIMKWQIEIFLSKSVSLGIGNILDISSLISTVVLVSVLMGLAFQFPVVLLVLLRVGLIERKQLSKQRQWVYLGSLIFAIMLPPDSILADILLALPLIFLFELVLIFGWIFQKKKVAVAKSAIASQPQPGT